MSGVASARPASTISARQLLGGLIAAAVVAQGAAAAAAPAAVPAAAFAPCPEREQRGWECATVTVPLDHAGARAGTIGLRVQRLAHAGPPRAKALVNVEGGPGASTTARSAQTRRLLGDVTARNGYELLLVDLRGTGRSGPEAIPLGTSRHYATADSVRDLELVREALGVERLALAGTSYSTLVAAEYARTFPARTDRLILDSPLRPSGPTWFDDGSARATGQVLADVCADAACPGGPAGARRDLAAVVRRLRGRDLDVGYTGVWRPRGRAPQPIEVQTRFTERGLLRRLVDADERTASFALLPAALRAAARGDLRPLARAGALTGAEPGVQVNRDVTRITRCLDMRTPWPFGAPFEERIQAIEREQAAAGGSGAAPFAPVALNRGRAAACAGFGPAGLPGAIRGGAIPDVPGVILQGAWDLRTPLANGRALAAAWPAGTLVTAPGTGHGVLRAATACATAAIDRLLAGRAVPRDACADSRPVARPLPDASSVAALAPLAGVPARAAKPAAAVLASARDAEVAVAVATPRGGEALVPGLLRGSASARRTPPSLATRIALHDYALVPGVVLDGTLAVDARARRSTLRVRISGAHRGRLALAGRRLTGRIDGVAVDVTLPAELAAPAVRRYG